MCFQNCKISCLVWLDTSSHSWSPLQGVRFPLWYAICVRCAFRFVFSCVRSWRVAVIDFKFCVTHCSTNRQKVTFACSPNSHRIHSYFAFFQGLERHDRRSYRSAVIFSPVRESARSIRWHCSQYLSVGADVWCAGGYTACAARLNL